MANHFFISDTHFGHANIITFTNFDGSQVRNFESMEHMHEVMIERWNSVVNQGDHVHVLGDIVINPKKGLPVLKRLNGRIRLIGGNHDPFDTQTYLDAGIEKISGVRVMDGAVLTHIPVHPDCIERFGVNVHGHLHNNVIKDANGKEDLRYLNVSVERLNFVPMAHEDLKIEVNRRLSAMKMDQRSLKWR